MDRPSTQRSLDAHFRFLGGQPGVGEEWSAGESETERQSVRKKKKVTEFEQLIQFRGRSRTFPVLWLAVEPVLSRRRKNACNRYQKHIFRQLIETFLLLYSLSRY